MKIYNIVFLLILTIVVLPICIYLKVRDLGLSKNRAIFIILSFPITVPKVHFKLFNELKHKDRNNAFKVLVKPIIDLPGTITMYSKSIILAEAKYKAIEELVYELNNEELNKFEEILKEENIKIKVKKGRLKRIRLVKDDKSKHSKLLNKINSEVKSEYIWNTILNEEIGATVRETELKRLTM